jgi:hypothetical protein
MQVIAMDAMAGNALHCSKSHSPILTGSIPSCLWALPKLESIHISSNGLSGKLPHGINQASLKNLSASYNRLSGTLPNDILCKPFNELDLSHNRFDGEMKDCTELLNVTAVKPSDHFKFIVNRVSGNIPNQAWAEYRKVDSLNGNIFTCSEPLPENDKNTKSYNCGSSVLDHALYFCGAVLICSLIAYLLLWYNEKGALKSLLLSWSRENRQPYPPSQTHMSDKRNDNGVLSKLLAFIPSGVFHKVSQYKIRGKLVVNKYVECEQIRYFLFNLKASRLYSMLLIFILTFLSTIIIVALKASNERHSSRTYQYSWYVSTAFLTGITPGVVVVLLWALVIYILIITVYTVEDIRLQHFSSLQPISLSSVYNSHQSGVSVDFSVGIDVEDLGDDEDEKKKDKSSCMLDEKANTTNSARRSSATSSISRDSRLSSSDKNDSNIVDVNPEVIETSSASLKYPLITFILVAFDFSVICAANAGYIASQMQLDRFAAECVQFFFAVFKVNRLLEIASFVLSFSYINMLCKKVLANILFVHSFIRWVGDKMEMPRIQNLTLRLILMLLNNVLAPLLATAVTDDSCLKDVFFKPPSISSFYQYRSCIGIYPDGACFEYVPAYQTVSFVSYYDMSKSINFISYRTIPLIK